jgi:DNA-binding IclR family transcriptional regulator
MPLIPSPAVLRACDVLDHLARHAGESFSVSELARLVSMPRATCDSVLLALAERGLVVRREPDLRYAIGPACIAIGDAARAALSVLGEAAPIAEELARSTHLCVALATRSGGDVRVAEVFDHGPAFATRTRIGESIPLAAPFGAVFVAWDGEEAAERWLDRAHERLSERERQRYAAALRAIRARGYSITTAIRPTRGLAKLLDELVDHPGGEVRPQRRERLIRMMIHTEYLPVEIGPESLQVSQMSAPIFDPLGTVNAAIMALGPSYEMNPEDVGTLGERLLAAARSATARVGGVAPPAPARQAAPARGRRVARRKQARGGKERRGV